MVASFSSCSSVPALVIVFSIYLSTFSLVEAGDNGGFSVDIIHRDSLLSPFYDPSVTHFERLQNALRRSMSRANSLKQFAISPFDVSSQVVSDNSGSYLMKMSFGTPPVERFAIADTGSNVIWIQCKPCERCYNQKVPLFDPNKSSTYRNLSCKSKECDLLDSKLRVCAPKTNDCEYNNYYGDGSSTRGFLATETFTLSSTSGKSVTLLEKIFGCGHNNQGTYDEGESGLVGLGGGSLSLISQLKSSIGGKFSYCLVPFEKENVTSKLNFGSEAVVSGDDVVSTPLVRKDPVTFYYVTLEAISVGNKRLPYKNSSKAVAEEGNIILDSGTTLTFIESNFYLNLESEVKKLIHGESFVDPPFLRLCYEPGTDVNVSVTFHFSGGADVKLKPLNTFFRNSKEAICFAIVPYPSVDDVGIFGNMAQMDFLVGHDLEKRKVYFKPADCSKH
ncbi:aspartic proteinase CDR1-like [Telopea speciosissima]|uniref:aspartic proteinase CDR1-like n=1 Tax=Telopea speciosissima TaxID=54955 RepID=UPI001CC4EADE|nr:aspartic proteinase CDR1-like [Telopea speciosissima]